MLERFREIAEMPMCKLRRRHINEMRDEALDLLRAHETLTAVYNTLREEYNLDQEMIKRSKEFSKTKDIQTLWENISSMDSCRSQVVVTETNISITYVLFR